MKKIFLAAISVILLLPFTACEGELPPAGEVVENMAEAMDEVETYRQDTDVTVRLYVMAEDEDTPGFFPLDMDVELNAATAHDLVNDEMETVMDIKIAGEDDDSIEMDMAFYIVGGDMYVMMDYPVMPPMWTKSEVPDMLASRRDNSRMMTELLQMADMAITGTESKEGVSCYVLEAEPDIGRIFGLLQGLSGGYDTEYPEPDTAAMDEVFRDFSVKMWVDKSSYRIIYTEINLQMEFSPGMMSDYGEEGEFSLDAAIKTHYHDYDRSVDIDLPPEAADATEGSLW